MHSTPVQFIARWGGGLDIVATGPSRSAFQQIPSVTGRSTIKKKNVYFKAQFSKNN